MTVPLAERDTLLSRLCGRAWPFAPLLDSVPVPPNSRVLDIGGEGVGCCVSWKGAAISGGGNWLTSFPAPTRTPSHSQTPVSTRCSCCGCFPTCIRQHWHWPKLSACWLPADEWWWSPTVLPTSRGCREQSPPTTADSPGRPTWAEPLLITVPLVLTTADQVTLAASHGRTFRPERQLETVLHLSGWTLCQG